MSFLTLKLGVILSLIILFIKDLPHTQIHFLLAYIIQLSSCPVSSFATVLNQPPHRNTKKTFVLSSSVDFTEAFIQISNICLVFAVAKLHQMSLSIILNKNHF